MALGDKTMKYAIQQRLRFIDCMLAYYGYINRITIMDYFGISQPQTSKDIQEYIKIAPNNIEYSKRNRRYNCTTTFVRIW